ncbi:uncharacterized protein N7483_006609 [Penicillium malachiteum]|uniref:uncharacterized protein n=1 Tax=Penicillium malachiteum TaxID=1324776 RepID=UPI00254809FD|nr:uncharacterized protein N7483_006609 [Penicillium malachiteum]KAJ5725252.1 hypothetical protein N7483_006609 [Penicillium malachiteum]
MIRLGTIVVGLPEEESRDRMQMQLWSWIPYCDTQIESNIAAIEHYSATVESRMPPGSHLPLPDFTPFFTDTDLDAAHVPQDCFIRSLLTRRSPHDEEAFAARQQFNSMRPYEEGSIPPVLLFTASATVNLNTEIRWLFNKVYENGEIAMNDGDPVKTGLYSEPTCRYHNDTEETGFRLLLPFPLNRAKLSNGSQVRPDSYTQLFQHGNFHWFGGEWRSQRLERLFKRWTELVESGVWTVGKRWRGGTN